MIYFIKCLDYVKIGCTNNIQSRINEIQVCTPEKIKLLGLINGNFEDEKLYHEKFKHINSKGEWFYFTKELENYIESLNKDLMWLHGYLENGLIPISNIKKCRLENNLSMEELGVKLGISKQAVKDMERRELQGRITINKLIKVYSVMGYKYEFRLIKSF